jgi:hypothetical protein
MPRGLDAEPAPAGLAAHEAVVQRMGRVEALCEEVVQRGVEASMNGR